MRPGALAAVAIPAGLRAVNPDKVQPGWLGLFVVAALGVAVFLLWRSLNRQLRKVDFPERPADDMDKAVDEDRDRPPD